MADARASRRQKSHFPVPPGVLWEQSAWCGPVGLMILSLGIVVLFRDFFFSDKMILGSDFRQAGFFFRSFAAAHVRPGGIGAHWNPYIFGGIPYIESFFGDLLYPPSVLLRQLGDLWRMLSYNLILHMIAAGCFMYWTARQFHVTKLAALTAAACYMFAATLLSLVAPWHDGKIFVSALFPLVIGLIQRGFQTKPWLYFTLLGVVIGLIILTPHIQMAYFSLWAAALFTLYKLIISFRETGGSLVSKLLPGGLAFYGVVLGLAISAIQFLPGYLYTKEYSPRADTKRGWDWATSWSMHEEEAFSLVIPEFAGAMVSGAETYYWGKNAFKDNSESIGAVAFFLGLVGLLLSRRRERWFFLGLAAFALVYALGATTPLFAIFYHLIPNVESLRAPSMIMFIFSCSFALLAAFGIDYLMTTPARNEQDAKRERTVLFAYPLVLCVLAVLFTVGGKGLLTTWTSIFFSDIESMRISQQATKLDAAFANLPAITSGAWLAFLFTGLTAFLLWSYRRGPSAAPIALLGVVALPMIDGVRFNSRFVETEDPRPYTQANAAVEFLKGQAGQDRVLDLAQQQGPSSTVLPMHGISIPAGYHGNQLRWYDDLLGGLGMPNISQKLNPRLLNLVGTKYLIFPAGQSLPADYFGSMPLRQVFSGANLHVMQNDNALPRAFLVDRVEVVSNRADIYPRLLGGADSLTRIAFVESPLTTMPTAGSLTNRSAAISNYSYDSLVITVEPDAPALLVLTDNWYPAWSATVDGQAAPLIRVNGTFRGVPLPEGAKLVVMRYESERYATGVLVTAVSSVWVVLVIGLHLFWRRKTHEGQVA